MTRSWAAAARTLLEERIGMRLSDSMLARLERLLDTRATEVGARGVDDYLARLAQPTSADELQRIVNLITIGKTSFNRFPEQVRAVVDVLLPALHRSRPKGAPLNIWSAACSTGQEPYTLCMALVEAGWYGRRAIRLVGSDVNTDAIEHARAGRYHVPRLDALPSYIRRWLHPDGNGHRLDDAIRRRVDFVPANLLRGDLPPGPWDLVVCANVLIYFGPSTIERVLERLRGVMGANAALLLGGAESLSWIQQPLRLVRFPGGSYGHLKGEWGVELSAHVVDVERQPPTPPAAGPVTDATRPAPSVGLQRSTAAAPPAAVTAEPPVATASSRAPTETLAAIEALAERGERGTAIEQLRRVLTAQPKDAHASRLLAKLLFAAHAFAEALEVLDDALETDPLAADLHFFQGWMRRVLGRADEAMDSFRRALFLEPKFGFARYELALSLHQRGEFDAAVAEYDKALLLTGAGASAPLPAQMDLLPDPTFLLELCATNRERALRGEPTPQLPGARAVASRRS